MPNENRNWIQEAQDYLYARHGQLRHRLDPAVNATRMTIDPDLDSSEAQYLILGLETGLFSVDEEGYVQSILLPPPPGKNTKQKVLQLFWATKNGWSLFREGVCQLATVSSLVLKYGWKNDQIVLEPSKAEFRSLAYGVDILVRDRVRNIIICGEVKKDRSEFHKLIEGFRYCCQRGTHAKDQCKFSRNHAKYEFCSAIRPVYFFATAPGEQVCFRLASAPSGVCIQEEQQSLIYS